jgi:tetratricopeptide (TPR) repeat protein
MTLTRIQNPPLNIVRSLLACLSLLVFLPAVSADSHQPEDRSETVTQAAQSGGDQATLQNARFAETVQPTGKHYRKAAKFTRNGEYDKAIKAFTELIEKSPQDLAARLGLSYALVKQGKLPEAFQEAATVVQADRQNSRAHALIGVTLLRTGNFKDSYTALSMALTMNEKDVVALAGMAEVDFFENRSESSYQLLRRATAIEPNEPDFWVAFGRAAARLERFKEAAGYYERFLAVSPKLDQERRERYRGLIQFYQSLSTMGVNHLHRIEGPRLARIPFRLQNDRPFVQVRIGNTTLNLVIDTGASISVLSHEAVEKLGIRPLARGGRARAVGGGGTFPIVYGLADSIDMGGVKIFNVPLYIRTIHSSKEPAPQPDTVTADGFLGLSVLSNFRLTIDYAAQQLVFENEPPPTNMGGVPENSSEVPFRTTNGGLVSAEIKLYNGETLNFLVDTGASATVLGAHVVKKFSLEKHILASPKIRVLGAAGIIEDVQVILLPSISMNGLEQKNVRAPVLNLEAVNETAGFMQAGILGGAFLKHFKVTFEFTRARMIFTPQTEGVGLSISTSLTPSRVWP